MAMKTYSVNVAALLCAAVMFVGCNRNDEPVKTDLNVSGIETTFEFEAEAEPVSFSIYSDKDWRIETADLGWLAVSPLSGKADANVIVTMTPEANSLERPRQGTLTVKSEGVSQLFTIKQKAY